jgi:hypothetical protein
LHVFDTLLQINGGFVWDIGRTTEAGTVNPNGKSVGGGRGILFPIPVVGSIVIDARFSFDVWGNAVKERIEVKDLRAAGVGRMCWGDGLRGG